MNINLRSFVFLLLVKLALTSYWNKTRTVETKYGYIIGSTEHSRTGRPYSAFRGIPYAKPPVGPLRFKSPEPPEPWNDHKKATTEGPFCIQKNYFFKEPKIEGQEDCLYLNIYVPNVGSFKPLPVLVFIHWGGFFSGRGTSDYIGPEYLMDQDIILVTFNYRLGVFGFFSTLDDNAPGNFGLKDQSMALRFIQENIHSFGGDAERVTLSGQSAGAGSVGLHLVSPLSKGLFHQAISQSGNGLSLWASPFDFLQSSVMNSLANFTNCPANDNSKLVICLRGIEAEDLAATADRFKYFSIEPITPYWVVTEKQTEKNPNPFLLKTPRQYWKDGEFANVPYIIGTVKDEGILRASALIRQPDTLAALNANFEVLITQMLGLALSTGLDGTHALYQEIIDFYLGGKGHIDVNNPKSVQGFIDLYSDRVFTYSTYQALVLQSKMGHSPIWFYNFGYRGEYSYGDLFAATDANINFTWGVSHCDDLLYLYKSPALFPDLEKSEFRMIRGMLTLWSNFVISGSPHRDWPPLHFDSIDEITNAQLNLINITGNKGNVKFLLQKGYLPERMEFWASKNLTENL